MDTPKVFLAIDLGAESGRAVAGLFDGQRLRFREVHRFANDPTRENESLHWDIERVFRETKVGISKAAERYRGQLVSIGVDSWGVDYALIDKQGSLLGKPYHYRDRRSYGLREKVIGLLGRDTIFQSTGIQFLPFNTLYQLVAEKSRQPSNLDHADCLLLIPDLLNYWLTGRKVAERTNASTTQFYDPVKKRWATALLEALGLPTDILCEIVDPGTRLGPLLEGLGAETGAVAVEVVLPGTHDTASAVAGVPAEEGNWGYLSSGTWCILGVEIRDPIITVRSGELGLGNEIGVCDTVRLLKNTSGLWLVQQCRNTWGSQGESLGYAEMTQMAHTARPFSAVIDPDDDTFVAPGDMPARIGAYCRKSGQNPPQTKGALTRTILESLALRYRTILAGLEEVVGHSVDTLHIVGGGAQNGLLNQFSANALNRRVIAGPVEATAAGNILVQMLAMGEIDSLQEGRDLLRRSVRLTRYLPGDTASWDAAYERFSRLPQARD